MSPQWILIIVMISWAVSALFTALWIVMVGARIARRDAGFHMSRAAEFYGELDTDPDAGREGRRHG